MCERAAKTWGVPGRHRWSDCGTLRGQPAWRRGLDGDSHCGCGGGPGDGQNHNSALYGGAGRRQGDPPQLCRGTDPGRRHARRRLGPHRILEALWEQAATNGTHGQ
jgi:hypothetical protein